jgi:hypothetical protein
MRLVNLLGQRRMIMHPFVLGKLAMGNLAGRDTVLADFADLPGAVVASDSEVLTLVNAHLLYGLDIGYIDARLLAAAKLSARAFMWTFDKRLDAAATRVGLAWRG